jgi:hypothetical protein
MSLAPSATSTALTAPTEASDSRRTLDEADAMIVSAIAGDMLSDLLTLTGRGLSGEMVDAKLANLLHLTRCLQWRVDSPGEPMPERDAAG